MTFVFLVVVTTVNRMIASRCIWVSAVCHLVASVMIVGVAVHIWGSRSSAVNCCAYAQLRSLVVLWFLTLAVLQSPYYIISRLPSEVV